MATHLALGKALEPMRIDRQDLSGKVVSGSAQLAPGHLQRLSLRHGVGFEQIVDGLIGGDKGQAVGYFEAFLAERTVAAQAAGAQSGLVHQLQGQAWFDAVTRNSGPATEQIPTAQAEVLGDEQPDPDVVAGDLIGQQLTDLTFQALGVAGFGALFAPSALGEEGGRRLMVRIQGVEFFFAGRNRR